MWSVTIFSNSIRLGLLAGSIGSTNLFIITEKKTNTVNTFCITKPKLTNTVLDMTLNFSGLRIDNYEVFRTPGMDLTFCV